MGDQCRRLVVSAKRRNAESPQDGVMKKWVTSELRRYLK